MAVINLQNSLLTIISLRDIIMYRESGQDTDTGDRKMLQAELTNGAKGLFFGNSWDVLADCCEYAWPKSPEGCWKHLKWVLANERISQEQYDEIKSNIVFVEYAD